MLREVVVFSFQFNVTSGGHRLVAGALPGGHSKQSLQFSVPGPRGGACRVRRGEVGESGRARNRMALSTPIEIAHLRQLTPNSLDSQPAAI